MRAAILTDVVVIGALAFWTSPRASAVTTARSGPFVLVLQTDAPASGPVHGPSFVLALDVQLQPYGMTSRTELWNPPPSLEVAIDLARARGAEKGAVAIVWYGLEKDAGAGEKGAGGNGLVIHVLDLQKGDHRHGHLELGPPGAGIERSMAAAIRTVLRATLTEAAHRATTAASTVPSASTQPTDGVAIEQGLLPSEATRPFEPVPSRFAIAVGYGADVLPLAEGGVARHGPELSLSGRVWRQWEAVLGWVYRLPDEGRSSQAAWTRQIMRFDAGIQRAWQLRGRWALKGSGAVRLGTIGARAVDLASSATESARLWELSLSLGGAIRFYLTERVALELGLATGWLPLGHRLAVRGQEVARSGHWDLGLGSALRIAAW